MKHTAVITSPPVRSGKECIPDGAIAGNGDLSVILGGYEKGLRVFVAKCDLWSADERDKGNGGIKPLGYVDFEIPKNLYENYYAEQRMDEGEIFCRFAEADKAFELTIFVSSEENSVLFKAGGNFKSEPKFTVFPCGADEIKEDVFENFSIVTRVFDNENLRFPCKVSAGIKKISEDKYVLCAATNFDRENFTQDVRERLESFDEGKFEKAKAAAAKWWKSFYEKSSFSSSDEQLELNWYASQYLLAVCAGNEKFPPGIYGNFITKEKMNWHGDYHLNYNYEAPFYAACSSNHPELTNCYPAPLEEFMEEGRKNAEKHLNCRGVYFPVGMAPKGLYSELCDDPENFERMFLGQKSNAAYAATVLVMRWNSTRDTEYAKEHIYPFLKAVGDFWEDFLVFENGRYVIHDDAIHEVPYYIPNFNPKTYRKHIHAVNPLLSLGLVRMLFTALLDISTALEADEERRQQWEHILTHLSDYPTFRRKFKKVYRYTEKGLAWWKGNTLCIQHIYPAGQIGLGSDTDTFKTARNTFFSDGRWLDDNGTNSYFPCAARLGVDPKLILKKLRLNYKKFQLPNLLMLHGGGCLENVSLTAATLNEMAVQSHEGIIRLFPVWDRDIDLSFKNLRADGAFLVSASCKGGSLDDIEIFSEQDGAAYLENPFDKCVLSYEPEVIHSERIIEIPMEKGKTVKVYRG